MILLGQKTIYTRNYFIYRVIMRKTIYSGPETDLYNHNAFREFMAKINAQHILSEVNLDAKSFQIWLLGGVVINYTYTETEWEDSSSVDLYENSSSNENPNSNLGEIEKLILDEASKINCHIR